MRIEERMRDVCGCRGDTGFPVSGGNRWNGPLDEGDSMNECELCGSKLPLAIMCHNAEPLARGFCCIVCNYTRVIPARMEEME